MTSDHTLISFNPHSRFAAILFYYEFHCCWYSVFYSRCTAWTCLCMLWGFKQYGEAWLALFRQAVNSHSRGLPGPSLIRHLYSHIHISIEVQYAFTRQVCLYICNNIHLNKTAANVPVWTVFIENTICLKERLCNSWNNGSIFLRRENKLCIFIAADRRQCCCSIWHHRQLIWIVVVCKMMENTVWLIFF